jgi:septal ring factor EnvC (AmiA/AmiB activator)
MILNEEQRNYIQILKEIIESNLFKSGFASIIKSSQDFKDYQKMNGDKKNIAEYFIDYTKCRQDNEILKKNCFELNSALKEAEFQINESKNKIMKLSNQNEMLNDENNKKEEQLNILCNEREYNQKLINEMSIENDQLKTKNSILKEK